MGFDLAPHLLDWVKVGAVRWQVPNFGPGGFDGGARSDIFVDGEVVHRDDVMRFKGGREDVLSPRREGRSVHRPVEHPGRLRSIAANGGDHRGGSPSAIRHVIVDAGAAGPAAIQTGHIRFRTGFVNEQETAVKHSADGLGPGCARTPDVRPIQLGWPKRLFFKGSPILSRA